MTTERAAEEAPEAPPAEDAKAPEGNATRTLSFGIMDDLRWTRGFPMHASVGANAAAIAERVAAIVKGVASTHDSGPGKVFARRYAERDMAEAVARDLLARGFHRINRFEKYHVVAFALDYTRFDVFSKDCDKEVIDWGAGVEGPRAGQIDGEDYRVNPVVRLLAGLS